MTQCGCLDYQGHKQSCTALDETRGILKPITKQIGVGCQNYLHPIHANTNCSAVKSSLWGRVTELKIMHGTWKMKEI